jgi:hypothetical protein
MFIVLCGTLAVLLVVAPVARVTKAGGSKDKTESAR